MQRQPLEVQTLYAELLERVAAFEAQRAIGRVPGTFVLKTIKGHDYYYFQYMEPGGSKRQTYLGRRTESLDALATRHVEQRALESADVADIERLSAILRAGGILRTDGPSARVIRALADSGVFRFGGVLVGTHAFVVLGNVLGVSWTGTGIRTQDVDIAAAVHVDVAFPSDRADLPDALDNLNMGFLPVPPLDPAGNSTSFKVRGQGLRVDLLTPGIRAGQNDVMIPRLNAWAQPLKFLDYAMRDVVSAAVIDGGAVAVNVPAPAHFALHKLLVANERPAAMHAKREKDLWQASQVLNVLVHERRGDLLLAWDRLRERGPAWEKRAEAGLGDLARVDKEVAQSVRSALRQTQ